MVFFASGLHSTIKVENGVLKPFAIFHKVAMVGLDSSRSIWPSIALLTPVSDAALSKLQPRSLRKVLRVCDMCAKMSVMVENCCAL